MKVNDNKSLLLAGASGRLFLFSNFRIYYMLTDISGVPFLKMLDFLKLKAIIKERSAIFMEFKE
ncbi:hypothetical protein DVV20_06205 [Lacticaseibacillus casei]|nr:hypothetical protein [Lacticaseibacillus casei]